MPDEPSLLSPERRQLLIDEIIGFFADERDLEIGTVAAEEILDFFLKKLNNEIYNQALSDAEKVIRQGNENTIVNLSVLYKP